MRDAFDVELFTRLNDEYRSKPLVPKPRVFDRASREREADQRAARLDRRLDLRGKRVLEIGCGTGVVGRRIAEQFGCTVVGIDVDRYDAWDDVQSPDVSYVVGDISDPPAGLGTFDAMFSFSVWEHIVHPNAALRRCFDLLNDGGRLFLQAQLERGPKASHRYREVYFPWPHLLFTDAVFEEYYVSTAREPRRPAWVNKLTYQQYTAAFDRFGYRTISCRASGPAEFDEDFYQRFHETLSAYPRWDLGHDVITALLERPVPEVDVPLEPRSDTCAGTPDAGTPEAGSATPIRRTADTVSLARRVWRRVPSRVRDHATTQRTITRVRRWRS